MTPPSPPLCRHSGHTCGACCWGERVDRATLTRRLRRQTRLFNRRFSAGRPPSALALAWYEVVARGGLDLLVGVLLWVPIVAGLLRPWLRERLVCAFLGFEDVGVGQATRAVGRIFNPSTSTSVGQVANLPGPALARQVGNLPHGDRPTCVGQVANLPEAALARQVGNLPHGDRPTSVGQVANLPGPALARQVGNLPHGDRPTCVGQVANLPGPALARQVGNLPHARVACLLHPTRWGQEYRPRAAFRLLRGLGCGAPDYLCLAALWFAKASWEDRARFDRVTAAADWYDFSQVAAAFRPSPAPAGSRVELPLVANLPSVGFNHGDRPGP